MTPRQLHRLLIAPEIIVVDLADAALRALDRALHVEHPLLDADPSPDDPHPRRCARSLLRDASRLRRSLHRYRCLVLRILRDDLAPDMPF